MDVTAIFDENIDSSESFEGLLNDAVEFGFWCGDFEVTDCDDWILRVLGTDLGIATTWSLRASMEGTRSCPKAEVCLVMS